MEEFDVAIIGGGPAGLAAFHKLKQSQTLKVVIIESGRSLDDRDRYLDSTTGIGGAGLYSDGKFSFFPSSTELWKLPNLKQLQESYDWTRDLLSQSGEISPPAFPQDLTQLEQPLDVWTLKEYPSLYLSLDARMKLASDLAHSPDPERFQLFNYTRVTSCEYSEESKKFTLELKSDVVKEISAKSVVYALGRFGPLTLPLSVPSRFYRVEIGVRIEDDSSSAFFDETDLMDPKYRFVKSSRNNPREWRTFCACRNGEVILGNTLGLQTYSGRADGPPTGKSNIGFNLRLFDPPPLSELSAQWDRLKSSDGTFRTSLYRVLQGDRFALQLVYNAFGHRWGQYLVEGLGLLAEEFPILKKSHTASLIGPTVEGVGWYPEISDELQVEGLPLWVAGDCGGKFRGIVSALISGHFVASRILVSQ